MSESLKRTLLVIGFVLVVVGIAAGLYFAFFKTGTTKTTAPTVEEGVTTSGLPSAGTGAPGTISPITLGTGEANVPQASDVAVGGLTLTTRLTASSVKSTTGSKDGQGISYYDPSDGRFYTIDEQGNIIMLSDKRFPSAESIVWNKNASSAVIEFPNGSNIVYDFDSEKQTTLPSHWEDFEFSPDSNQIIAKSLGSDPNARSLVITNADGSNTKVIAALGDKADKVDVNWSPNDQVVAFSDTGQAQTGFGRRMIIPIGKNNENYKGLVVEGINFHALWSPDGAKVLYDVSGEVSDYKPLLWVVDGTPSSMGDNRRSLGINTWVEKCVFFSSSTAYCAVPQLLDDNAGLQPNINSSIDSLYKINVDSGKVVFLGTPTNGSSMSNLSVSTDESLIYYTDDSDRIQVMKLK